MNYPGSLNLGDVRQVFSDGRARTEWKPEGMSSFPTNRGQPMATVNPRLQQLHSIVAGWQGGEGQAARAVWSIPYPMATGDNTLEEIKKQQVKNTADIQSIIQTLENVVQTVQGLRASLCEYQDIKRQWEEEKRANEEKLRKIQGLIERMVAHFPAGDEATIDPTLTFSAMPGT